MMNCKKLAFGSLTFWLWISSVTYGDLISWDVNTAIPDGEATGLQNTQTISGLQEQITSLEVHLKIQPLSGELVWNGDYYVSLQHDSGFSVLLNRVGKTAADPLGASDNGFDIIFSLTGGDIHSYESQSPTYGANGELTGTWGVDGRDVDPDLVLDTDSQTAMLSSFMGLDPNGEWTLFVADMNSGGKGQLSSWGLNIEAVPEPAAVLLVLLGGGVTLLTRRFSNLREA